MRLYNKMNLSQRIIMGFLIIALVTAIIGGVSVINMNKMSENDKELYTNMTVPLKTASEISKLFQKSQIYSVEMILENDSVKIEEKFNEFMQISSDLEVLNEEFQNKILSTEMQEAYDSYIDTRSQTLLYVEEFYSLCTQNLDDEAFALYNNEIIPVANAQEEAIDTLVSMKATDAEERYNLNNSLASSTSIKMIIYVFMAIILSVSMGYVISRLIGKPIIQMLKAANSIANGNLDIELNVKSTSEIGELATAFGKMSESLNSTIAVINTASDQVASGAKQVSDSSLSLSQGSTEQASSIEQLSSSIKEITVQNNKSSEKRERAKNISTTALETAKEGFSQMNEMVSAMSEIQSSSINISKILKVIDEIAFQTNILALNAAVEAARAGKYGKGFAVVAEEVRNLAGRSAEAAKETSELIENLETKVQTGDSIANITSKSLTIIVDTFSEIDTIIQNISLASEKQAVSLNQINEGVIQISDVVQANSATSEQTAAASEELSGQAQMLKDEILKFKLKDNTTVSYSQRLQNSEELTPEVLALLENMNKNLPK
ncbi:methyl-accepting chemotaxis protein [Clostridium sp. DL1XJH146]